MISFSLLCLKNYIYWIIVIKIGTTTMNNTVLITTMSVAAFLMRETFIVQAATPALAVLPILANEAHGDVKYATDVVVMSTVLFIVVVPILMTIIQYI